MFYVLQKNVFTNYFYLFMLKESKTMGYLLEKQRRNAFPLFPDKKFRLIFISKGEQRVGTESPG